MEKFITSDMYNVFLEMYLGIMALRLSEIQSILVSRYFKVRITSSYSDRNQDLQLVVPQMIAEIQKQGLTEPKNLRNEFTQINKVFLISAWDLLTDTQTYNSIATEPEIQFFRHIRNGCAHENRFNFKTLEHPAKWRDKEITLESNGKTVLPDFVRDGDPLLLLLDINNKYFEPITIDGYIPYES